MRQEHIISICVVLSVLACGCRQQKALWRGAPENITAALGSDIVKLSSASSVTRGNAAFRLGEIGKEAAPATPYLVKMLNDRAPLVWTSEPFGTFSSSTSPAQEAIDALGKIRDPRAVSPLIGVLKDGEERIRNHAASALGMLNDPRAVTPIIDAMKNWNEPSRKIAVIALAAIDDPRAVKVVVDALKKRELSYRDDIASSLGRSNNPDAMEALIDYSLEGSSTRAVEIIGKIQNSRVSGALAVLLKSDNPQIREFAANAIGERKEPGATELLIEALNDPVRCLSWWHCRPVALALGELGDRRAVGPLIGELKRDIVDTENPGVRRYENTRRSSYWNEAVIPALRKLTGMDFGNDRGKWLEWFEREKRN